MQVYKYLELTDKSYLEIAEILKSNGIIIYPTDTIYGIGGEAFNNNVYNKIFKIKNRPKHKNYLLLFKDFKMLTKYVNIRNNLEKKIIEKYWPGEVTVILKSQRDLSEIACRISSHPFITKLFQFINFPIVSTSANISGDNYIGEIEKIFNIFKYKVDAIIDNGDMKGSPSTIVKVVNNKVEVVRQGKVIVEV